MAYIAERSVTGLVVSSAGTRAMVGHPIDAAAVKVLQRLGGDASGFAARQLNARTAADADLILTMTRAHRDEVLELAPSKLHRTFMLSEAALLASDWRADKIGDLSDLRSNLKATDLVDVPDPMGKGAEAYDMAGSLIAELLPAVLSLCCR